MMLRYFLALSYSNMNTSTPTKSECSTVNVRGRDPLAAVDVMDMPFWKVLKLRGNVRSKFLYLTPEDIMEIDCRVALQSISDDYCAVESDESQNVEEWAYISLMKDMCKKRLSEL